jgi:hypothetical protein
MARGDKMKWKDTDLYLRLYEKNPKYGADGAFHFRTVHGLVKKYNIQSVFDYGCGQNYSLLKSLQYNSAGGLTLCGYDPAIVQNNEVVRNELPTKTYDMLVSTDCLEHVYEDELPQCKQIFDAVDPRIMYLVISTRIARQKLDDGSNAHKTVQTGVWWERKLNEFFCSKYLVLYTNSFYEEFEKNAKFFLKKL